MNISTKFDIGQSVYQVTVSRIIEDLPCPVCGGEGSMTTTAVDGSEHRVGCPNDRYFTRDSAQDTRCHSGRIHVGLRHTREVAPRRLTVGQIRIQVGADPEERVMCEETGVGSGTLHDVEPQPVDYRSRGHHYGIFGTHEEAVEWGDAVVAECNRLLGVELKHEEAIRDDDELFGREEG